MAGVASSMTFSICRICRIRYLSGATSIGAPGSHLLERPAWLGHIEDNLMGHDTTPTLLLDDRLAPITREIGFVDAGWQTVVETFLTWTRPIFARGGIDLKVSEVRGDLATLLQLLPPLTAGELTRHLLVPTTSPWTALFNNGLGGSDVSSEVVSLSGFLRCRALRALAVSNTIRDSERRGRYGAVGLELYGPEVDVLRLQRQSPDGEEIVLTTGTLARAIVAMNDGGRWRYALEGEPLPFEQPEHYTARRIKDRFTLAMLRDYLAALGIRAFNADFYAPDRVATLIELVGTERYVVRTLTLEEARAHFLGSTNPGSAKEGEVAMGSTS